MYPVYGYNPFIFMPYIPRDCDKPPTVYAILNSIVNYGKDDKEKIKNLAKLGRTEIFDFDYNLTNNISKEDFEVMILNHYLMRRIGYETVTAFKIALNVKLNEIMPKYNILFDSIKNWNLFTDGQIITKTGNNSTTRDSKSSTESESEITSNNSVKDKRKHSDLPQNELQNIDDSRYVNQYDNDNTTSDTTSNNTGSVSNTVKDDSENEYSETIKYTQGDLINLYSKFQIEVQNVYTMLFRELDVLFYGLI